LKVTET